MRIVITGGHHSSALPVIEVLKRTEPDIDLVWFGHKYSMVGDRNTTLEFREVTSLNIPFYEIHAGKFYRTLNIKRLLKIPYGFFQSLVLLNKIKPDVILSFGGYVAVPVVLAGWFLNIPAVTHEQTLVAGYANKLISRFASKILLSWDESKRYFPTAKSIVTGIPLRKDISEIRSSSFIVNEQLPTIYITAGKTGSVFINHLVAENLEELLQKANIVHQCGDHSKYNYCDRLTEKYRQIKQRALGSYYVRKFVFNEEIGEAYSKADMVISRAGAHTIAEVLYLEKPCLLIPIPWVSHNEQYENAKFIEGLGLGKVLEEKDAEKHFCQEVLSMLSDLSKYKLNDVSKKNIISVEAPSLIAHEVLHTAES